MFKKMSLEFKWTLEGSGPFEAWLPVPISDPNQRVMSFKFVPKPENEIAEKNYSYGYFRSRKGPEIKAQADLTIRKIESYKGPCSDIFLKDNSFLKVSKIRPFAEKLGGPEKFYEWIIENIRFPGDMSKYLENLNYLDNACNVLHKKEGECSGKSLLFISMCRSVGIPARLVSGYFAKSGEVRLFNSKLGKDSLGLHQWAEFHENGKWVPVDCSLAQEEKKDYFGKFHDYRIIISKDTGIKLFKNGYANFMQIGFIDNKCLKNLSCNLLFQANFYKTKNQK